jgi:hypothetical protein
MLFPNLECPFSLRQPLVTTPFTFPKTPHGAHKSASAPLCRAAIHCPANSPRRPAALFVNFIDGSWRSSHRVSPTGLDFPPTSADDAPAFCDFWSRKVDFLRLFSLFLRTKNTQIPNNHRTKTTFIHHHETRNHPQIAFAQFPEKKRRSLFRTLVHTPTSAYNTPPVTDH